MEIVFAPRFVAAALLLTIRALGRDLMSRTGFGGCGSGAGVPIFAERPAATSRAESGFLFDLPIYLTPGVVLSFGLIAASMTVVLLICLVWVGAILCRKWLKYLFLGASDRFPSRGYANRSRSRHR